MPPEVQRYWSCAVLTGGGFLCPPVSRVWLPGRREMGSVHGQEREGFESRRWECQHKVGSHQDPVSFSPSGQADDSLHLVSEQRRVGIVYQNLIERMPPTGRTVSLRVFLHSAFPRPPVCGTEFDLSLVLRSKKKSFLLMFAIRHTQCGVGGWGRAVLASRLLSWSHGGP